MLGHPKFSGERFLIARRNNLVEECPSRNSCPLGVETYAFNKRVKPAANSMEREARLAKQRAEAEQAMAERQQSDEAFRANYERLKAERLAREDKPRSSEGGCTPRE